MLGRMTRGVCVMALTATAALTAAPARGQNRPRKKPAAAQAAPVDLDTDQPQAPAPVQRPAMNAPPSQAGRPSRAAVQARKLYESEKWAEAARALYRVTSGETGDDEGNKELAQFNLAKSLYKLRFYQAAYAIFSEISDKPNHLKYDETLLWLAKLATDLPETADIIERVGKYDEEHISKFDNAEQRDLFWQLDYLLGRYKYRNGQFPEALALFDKVGRKSRYYVQAQFFGGITNVQMRQSKPAVQAFQRVLGAIEEGDVEVEDEARMRDLAYLSMARTFYSASVKLDETTNSPTVDQTRLSAAVKYWNKVDVASEYWLDALFEESWAYFMAGDYSHALGNIHTIESPYFPHSYYPEADVLRAVIYFANCQYDDAFTIVAKFRAQYEPIRDELTKTLNRFQKGANQEEAFYTFLKDVRDDKAQLDERVAPIVKTSLSDRQLLRSLQYVHLLDEEAARFARAPETLKDSKVADFVRDSIHDARELAIRNAGDLARTRYERNLADLNEQLRNGQKILIDITAAQRNQIDQALQNAQVTAEESKANIVKPDEEHVIWPFNGEYWRDELGFYRQTITSKCGR
jgi:outer membrane protein assembly factor BamD (BamD/ComL family)